MLAACYFWAKLGVGKPPARFCEGEAEWSSYSTRIRLRLSERVNIQFFRPRVRDCIIPEAPRSGDCFYGVISK